MTFYPGGERYEGEWSNGLRNGWGRMYYWDGSIYEGQWLEDRPGGQGMLQLRKYRPPSPNASACPLQGVWCHAALQMPLPSRFLDATSHLLLQPCVRVAVAPLCLPSPPGLGLEAAEACARAGVVLFKPTRMKAYFCCDLHLNDWDG